MNLLTQLQSQNAFLQAALVFSILANAVVVGGAAAVIVQFQRERTRSVIDPLARTVTQARRPA